MELRKLGVKHYKCFSGDTTIEIAPLTILVGANNSGKTALVQAVHLLASSISHPIEDSREPLKLNSDGIFHGREFVDLVSGRSAHGSLSLFAELVHDEVETSLAVNIQNIERAHGPSERQISRWSYSIGNDQIEINRVSLDAQSPYQINHSGKMKQEQEIHWVGILPYDSSKLLGEHGNQINQLKKWANGVRYLKSPRSYPSSGLFMDNVNPSKHDVTGSSSPKMLAEDDNLRDSVKEWYRIAFNVSLDIKDEGKYFDLAIRSPASGASILLDQTGSGLSQVLPVVVIALTAGRVGPGIDIIEHPEAELHPASHGDIAELLLSSLTGNDRPMIIETHSEMILLRARRWIVEGRLSADHVLVYWVDSEPGNGSVLKKITINDHGEMSVWPEGVFTEDYEEVLAIRRAVRQMED